MQSHAFPNATLGYCTNVHAGASLGQIKAQLEEHAVAVKQQISPDQPMGVGLWFPESVAGELDPAAVGKAPAWDLKRWLAARGLFCFTLNGFPQQNFHAEVVKHDVYQPNWTSPQRRSYTLALVRILDALLPDPNSGPRAVGSISTLPIGWGDLDDDQGWIDPLLDVVEALARLEHQTGRCIHLNLEPEPGCFIEDTLTLDTAIHDLEAATDHHDDLRRYLRVCLDVCHAAVMFEPADHLLKWCRRTGYRVGKVQVSSALRLRFGHRDSDEVLQARWQALQSFAEPRYLHQTTWGHPARHRQSAFFDDLPEALEDWGDELTHPDEWRVHFHVPIHLEHIGPLSTTQDEILKLLRSILPEDGIEHFEVETYAWNVLPPNHRPARLADGIAAEMRWLQQALEAQP